MSYASILFISEIFKIDSSARRALADSVGMSCLITPRCSKIFSSALIWSRIFPASSYFLASESLRISFFNVLASDLFFPERIFLIAEMFFLYFLVSSAMFSTQQNPEHLPILTLRHGRLWGFLQVQYGNARRRVFRAERKTPPSV